MHIADNIVYALLIHQDLGIPCFRKKFGQVFGCFVQFHGRDLCTWNHYLPGLYR